MIIFRSISAPIREGLSLDEQWRGPDGGLIVCWERGRQKAEASPELAAAAKRGELIPLCWKGGVEKALRGKSKIGTLFYYATWLGLRGDDLHIDTEQRFVMTCTRYGVPVNYTGKYEEYANAGTESE